MCLLFFSSSFFLPRLTPASLSARFGATFLSLVSHFHCGFAPGWCVLACRLEAGPGKVFSSVYPGIGLFTVLEEVCKNITDLDHIR